MPRRCAFGCMPNDGPMHRFPDAKKFPEQFKTWVRLVGGNLATSSDFEYYQNKRICDKHFIDEHRNRNNRLSALAIPLLHCPAQAGNQVIAEPLLISTQNSQPGVTHPANTAQAGNQVIAEPLLISTQNSQPVLTHPANTGQADNEVFVEPLSILTQNSQPRVTHPANTGLLVSQGFLEGASTSTQYPLHFSSQHGNPGISQPTSTLHSVTLEHNYSALSKLRRTAGKGGLDTQLRNKIKYLRSEISRLRRKGTSFQARLKSAEDLSDNKLFQHLSKTLKKPAQLFLKMQLQASKKPKGRRFTTEEKVLSLSLYKKSPKCYGLLNKLFTLPSAKAMKRLLSNIKISPGINPIVFNKIKKTVLEKNVSDRLCSLMFDEMSLTPQVNYIDQKDVFEGFASNRNSKFADHALVFMVKGIKQSFKQPIAYYFTAKLNKIELKNLIKEVIKYAQDAGLIIINTVCDQSTVNVGAVKELVDETKAKYLRKQKEWRHDFFSINGKKNIPIFDVPHLIKGIRNNLMTKNMIYTSNNEEKVLKWEYFEKVYAADKSYGELRLLDKLTEEHINPEKINKMRVKSATQLFSHSVAVATEHLAARGDLPQECKQIIEITLLLDNLFDSLNGSTFHIPNGKKYKGPVKRHSPHHELWKKAKLILKTVKFRVNKIVKNKMQLIETTIPSVTNFIKTIEGMEAIWNILSQKYGLDTLLTRNFNQDPVENFFGNIRSYGARNNSPNSVAFEAAFKALLLNNYNSPHSVRANCEDDLNECLQTLDFFITEKNINNAPITSDISSVDEDVEIQCNEELFTCHNTSETDVGQRNYVCGWVLTKCLKMVVKKCECCRQNLIDKESTNVGNSFIRAKEFENKKWLCYPSEGLTKCFHDLQNITVSFLKNDVPKKNIKRNIISIADALVEFPFNCIIHKEKLKQYFMKTTINVLLYSWCRSVNRILSGKLKYSGEDKTKIAAQEYYNKHKHYKNKK